MTFYPISFHFHNKDLQRPHGLQDLCLLAIASNNLTCLYKAIPHAPLKSRIGRRLVFQYTLIMALSLPILPWLSQ